MILLPQKVAYRGTISGLRISSVDGTAFLDACAALVPYADGSHLVEIYDASGNQLKGYLSAQGAGETLDSELVLNGTMEAGDPPTSWLANGGSTISSVADERTAGAGSKSLNAVRGSSLTAAYQSFTIVVGALYKVSGWAKNGDATNVIVRFSGGLISAGSIVTESAGAWDDGTGYATSTTSTGQANALITGATGKYGRFDDISTKKVLTPSTSGATIVSAAGGATQNFTYKNSSFTYNAASYYCLIKRAR